MIVQHIKFFALRVTLLRKARRQACMLDQLDLNSRFQIL